MNTVKFKRSVTAIVLSALAIHLLIALSLTFFSNQLSLTKSKGGRIYEYLVHLGPFYREDAIKSSPHFVASVNGRSTDLIATHAERYRDSFWRVNELLRRDIIRRSADTFRKSGQRKNSPSYRKLLVATQYLRPEISEGDSVTWVYFHRWYLPEGDRMFNDTVFQYKTIVEK